MISPYGYPTRTRYGWRPLPQSQALLAFCALGSSRTRRGNCPLGGRQKVLLTHRQPSFGGSPKEAGVPSRCPGARSAGHPTQRKTVRLRTRLRCRWARSGSRPQGTRPMWMSTPRPLSSSPWGYFVHASTDGVCTSYANVEVGARPKGIGWPSSSCSYGIQGAAQQRDATDEGRFRGVRPSPDASSSSAPRS